MRWDSPFVLATAGTIAIHVLLAVIGDAIVQTRPRTPVELAPEIEMVDIELPPPPPPPAAAPPEPTPAPVPPVAVHHVSHAPAPAHETPPPVTEPPPITAPGGEQTVTLPDLTPSATGVAVAPGPTTTGKLGRGGSGGGTATGSGSGAGDKPMSVATIKTRAMPRGDYGYESIKDYPDEAKQLGIEGQIRVRLVVDDHGVVKSSVLLNRLGHGLDELALARAKTIQFEPARDTDDRPVASVVVWTFTMTFAK